MAVSEEYLAYVLDQLQRLGLVQSRRMFGGASLSRMGYTFGLISDDVLYFKVDDSNRADYEAAGMKAFAPYADKPNHVMSYYEVPADVLEDTEQLKQWAETAYNVALRAKKKPKRK